MSDDIKRDWISEAAAIADGKSSLLPERQHLVVLAQHAEAAIRHQLKLGEIVLAIMVDNGVQRLPIPGGILHSVRARRLGLEIQPVMKDSGGPVADGSLIVVVAMPAAPTPKGRVN